MLDRRGEVLKNGWLDNERNELAKLASAYLGALVIMEAGIHSPWISRFLDSLGMEVVVANSRKTRTIWQSERKSDESDALEGEVAKSVKMKFVNHLPLLAKLRFPFFA